MRRLNWQITLCAVAIFVAACGGQMPEQGAAEADEADETLDAEDASFAAAGKSDWAVPQEGSKEADGVLAVVNTADFDTLDASPPAGVGLHPIPAEHIVEYRNGPDGRPDTDDDETFDTLAELDTVPYVGLYALTQLVDYARANGLIDAEQPPRLEITGEQVTTENEGEARLARVKDGLVVANYIRKRSETRDGIIAWRPVDPQGFEDVDEETRLDAAGRFQDTKIDTFEMLSDDDNFFFGWRSYVSHSTCRAVGYGTDDLSESTYVHQGSCAPLRFATDGTSVVVIRQRRTYSGGTGLSFQSLTGSDDEEESSKAWIHSYDEDIRSPTVAMAFSPALDRYVVLYRVYGDEHDTVYSTLVKPIRNFGSPDVDPVAIMDDSDPDVDKLRFSTPELIWDGEGFGLFTEWRNTVSFQRLDASGQPVAETREILSDAPEYDVIRHRDHYVMVTRAESDERPHAHLIGLDGVVLSSVQLSDEPAKAPAVTAVDGGYTAAWTDPNDKINLIRFKAVD